MGGLMRRIRGAIGTGLTWAAGWLGVGAILGVPISILLGLPVLSGMTVLAVGWAKLGFVGGVLFSGVLAAAEHNRSIEDLSLRRIAAWGAVGGFLLAVPSVIAAGMTPFALVPAGVAVLLGAGSAAGSLAIARAMQSLCC